MVYHTAIVALYVIWAFAASPLSAAVKYPKDCQDVRNSGFNTSGVYKIHLNINDTAKVYCDHQPSKSYTIVQQRMFGNENFYRGYHDYETGFGVQSGDYWAGLAVIYHLTSAGNTQLDIQLQDWAGNNRGGTYSYFRVSDKSDRYRVQIGKFSGNVPDDLSFSNGMQFATYDAPDIHRCAVNQKGGWWYNYCAYALLNGQYYHYGPYTPSGGYYDGIYWKDWLGYGYSLRFTRMMLSTP